MSEQPEKSHTTTERPFYGGDILGVALPALVRESRQKSLWMVGLFIALSVSIVGNIVQFQYLPPTKVVSETPDGRIRPLPTIDEPIFTNEHVLNWAASKAEAAYDIPFTEINTYPGRIRDFMLEDTANQFIAALTKAGILDKVASERLILRGVRTAPPTLTDTKIVNGRYVWTIEIPLATIYEGAKGREIENVVLRMFVGREHLMRAEDGLVIGSINVFPGRGPR